MTLIARMPSVSHSSQRGNRNRGFSPPPSAGLPSREPSTFQGCWSLGFSGRGGCGLLRCSAIGLLSLAGPQVLAPTVEYLASMHFDFADLLLEVLERRASDLHITAG